MTTLVSHRYRYIFIHIPKNAGSSIQTALMRCESFPALRRMIWRGFMLMGSGTQTIAWRRTNSRGSLGWSVAALAGHAHAIDLKEILPGSIFDRYFKFAIVRNPWDRCVSRFEYYRQVNEQRGRTQELMNFEAFLERDFQPQKKRISDANGNLLVDFVGRTENLAADMNHVYERCGLPLARTEIPRINQTVRRDYREYYNDRTRQYVHEKYREDVEFFGYEF